MTAFLHYRTNLSEVIRLRPGLSWLQATRLVVQRCHEVIDVPAKIALDEYSFYVRGRQTLYVDSKVLLEKLKVNGNIGPLLAKWRGMRSINFLAGTTANGHKMYPCLFGYMPHEDRLEALEEVFDRGIDLTENSSGNTIHISIRFNPHMYHITLPVEDRDTFVNDKDWLFDRPLPVPGNLPISRPEIAQERQQLLTCLGLVLYAAAYPNAIRPGLPEGYGRYELGPEHKRTKNTTLKVRNPSAEPFPRSAHYRILGHERFKRDADGMIRVIPVRESIVGGSLEVYSFHTNTEECGR